MECGGAQFGCQNVDARRVDIAQRKLIAARCEQPGAGVSDPGRTAENERSRSHATGF